MDRPPNLSSRNTASGNQPHAPFPSFPSAASDQCARTIDQLAEKVRERRESEASAAGASAYTQQPKLRPSSGAPTHSSSPAVSAGHRSSPAAAGGGAHNPRKPAAQASGGQQAENNSHTNGTSRTFMGLSTKTWMWLLAIAAVLLLIWWFRSSKKTSHNNNNNNNKPQPSVPAVHPSPLRPAGGRTAGSSASTFPVSFPDDNDRDARKAPYNSSDDDDDDGDDDDDFLDHPGHGQAARRPGPQTQAQAQTQPRSGTGGDTEVLAKQLKEVRAHCMALSRFAQGSHVALTEQNRALQQLLMTLVHQQEQQQQQQQSSGMGSGASLTTSSSGVAGGGGGGGGGGAATSVAPVAPLPNLSSPSGPTAPGPAPPTIIDQSEDGDSSLADDDNDVPRAGSARTVPVQQSVTPGSDDL